MFFLKNNDLTDNKSAAIQGFERLILDAIYNFSVLANSENTNNVQGYIRSQENNLAIIKGMEHCFCNALLNYSGLLKYKTAKDSHNLIIAAENFNSQYESDPAFRMQLSDLSKKSPFEYQMIMTKIEHPELNMATEYYFDKFEAIEYKGEVRDAQRC